MIKLKRKVLLIEDDIVLASSISELLQLSDYEVSWFSDGLAGLIYLNKNIPDLIISDLMMPHMNGEEFFLTIRKNSKYNTIPFIMITANIDTEIKLNQLENGVNDFIIKPFKIKELVYKIKNLLELKKNIEKKYTPDPFSKITIKLSEKDFLNSLNEILIKKMKSKIDIDDLSKELFISKSTLDKRVRKRTNKNVSQYIREFKLDYAIKLIRLGETNIQCIVDETGFNSLSYFSTSFKSYMKVTPRDFIKSNDAEN